MWADEYLYLSLKRLLIEEGLRQSLVRVSASFWTSTRPTILCTGLRKDASSTVITGTIAICHCIALPGTRLEKATIGTLRLRLFKIAARVKLSVRVSHFELASGSPDQDVFAQVWKNLQVWPS
jgi:hypothetical protein